MKTCLFCDNKADSKEHVVSKRLANRMGIQNEGMTVVSLTQSRGIEKRNPYSIYSSTCRCVCTTCNNGWMNDLEAFMEESIGGLIEPKWPPSSFNGLTTLASNHDRLYRWMLKTACVMQVSGLMRKEVISQDKMRQTRCATSTSDISIYAGFIRYMNLDMRLEKGFRVWEHGRPYLNREHREGYSFAIQMNYLALRLVVCPQAEIMYVMPYGEKRQTMPIFLTQRAARNTLEFHTYDTMRDFYNSIELKL